MIQPGHAFGRIHVDDIAAGVMAAVAKPPQGARVLNFSDDAPTESAVVTAEAANLLGVPVPPAVPFDEAVGGMSEMARSFWAENRRVRSAATQAALGLRWRYPSYREGLARHPGRGACRRGGAAGLGPPGGTGGGRRP